MMNYKYSNRGQRMKPVAKNSGSLPPASASSYKRQRSISFTHDARGEDKSTIEGTLGNRVLLREDSIIEE